MYMIANNLLPVIGVLFLGWSAFEVLVLYWAESVIFTFFVLMRMTKTFLHQKNEIEKFLKSLALFIVVYTPFLFVQYLAIIIFAAFTDELKNSDIREGLLAPLWQNPELLIAVSSTLIAYSFSYYRDFIKTKMYENNPSNTEFGSPVKQIMVVQFTVLCGGFLAVMVSRVFSLEMSTYRAIMVGMLILAKNLADINKYRKVKRNGKK